MHSSSDVPLRPGAARLLETRIVTHAEAIDARKRRLRFRVWHRGMREVDLILGRFADARLGTMGEAELSAFEALLDTPDPDVLAWVLGERPIPPDRNTTFLRELIAFHRGPA
jgi:antitoxin CptB